MKRTLLSLLFSLFVFGVSAQTGEVSGKVTDENGEGIPFANVAIVDDGVATGQGTTTDFDGNYSIKPLTPGTYDVKFTYIGYAARVIKGVVVSSDKTTFLDEALQPADLVIEEIEIIEYKVPLIDPGKTSTGNTVTAKEISALPTKNVTSIAASTAGVYQADEGDGLSVKGGRQDGTEYYVDGIKVRGSTSLPTTGLEQVQVISGGIPAKYGDATGGVVSLTTKSPTRKFHGGLELLTSQFLDPYGYNLAGLNISGPILKKKDSEQTLLGFQSAVEFISQEDPDPSAIGVPVVKADKLAELQQTPLIANPIGEGFILASETITKDDVEISDVKPNTQRREIRYTGKLDFKPSDATRFVVGGTANYRRDHGWVERYTLLNTENNPLNTNETYRGYARFTHNLGQKNFEEGEERTSSAFQNAYYTIQVDYEKTKTRQEDDTHGENIFNYGYIGKFETMQEPVYQFGTHDIVDENGKVIQTLTGDIFVAVRDTEVVFTPSDLNPNATIYTETYYDLVGDDPTGFYENINQIRAFGGLVNGQRSTVPHSVWFNTGRQFNGYNYSDNDQYSLRVNGAFDILKPGASTRNKHAIEFGVSFEQRIDRNWAVSPLNFWDLMEQFTNFHLDYDFETNNPILVIDGVEYDYDDPNRPEFTANDRIVYPVVADFNEQKTFDANLRTKLGLDPNGTDFIDLHSIDPSTFSIDMFSADELLNDGSPVVAYQGYDYTGKKLTGTSSFNDFYTKQNDDGTYVRDIPAFQPIYAAAYIQDKFHFKDLTFNVGLRVDRFDANQKVWKDDFSLYAIKTVGEAQNGNADLFSGYELPNTIGDEFAVYVDNSDNPTRIIGFRDGDTWYGSDGNRLSSGEFIASSSSSGQIEPLLVDPTQDVKEEGFDPDQSFKDYDPQITVMPRLQFAFNLTEKALFFAHYDILTQRPQSRIAAGPDDWYFFQDNAGLRVFNNPALKPEKTIDFQLGFRQRVSTTSAITINAFFREQKDMVQVIRRANAYPSSYNTFGNVDFGTTKGFSIAYDLRRTGNVLMKANYSIQFAEGTGSNTTSQINSVSENKPNLRTLAPLDFDSRHTINLTLDYRYASGSEYNGPVVGGKDILSNSGINLQMLSRSGTPYTQQRNATPEALRGVPSRPISEGSLNGSRLPWTLRFDTKINKTFNVMVGGKKEGSNPTNLNFDVYLQVQNLLDARNVSSVYRFTGNPDDDGYLGSLEGQQAVDNAVNSESFQDLYELYINRPNNYTRPRTIRLGAVVGF